MGMRLVFSETIDISKGAKVLLNVKEKLISS